MRNEENIRHETQVLSGWQVVVLFVALAAGPLAAEVAKPAPIQTTSIPCFLFVDLEYYLPTSLRIKCDTAEYNQPFAQFRSQARTPAESKLCELVLAMHAGDAGHCADMAFVESGTSEDKAKGSRKVAELWASDLRSGLLSDQMAGVNLEVLQVYSQIHLGDSALFILGTTANPGEKREATRFALQFSPGADGTLRWDTRPSDDLESVLHETARQSTVPAQMAAVPSRTDFAYEVPIPLTPGPSHRAYLQFNGVPYNCRVLSDTLKSSNNRTDEVVRLCQREYRLMADGAIQNVADLYTAKSRANYLAWVKAQEGSSGGTDWRARVVKRISSNEPAVRFVIDADPLYVVFLRHPALASLECEYVVRDQQDNTLKLTQWRTIGFLDGLITQLRPPLTKSLLSENTESK